MRPWSRAAAGVMLTLFVTVATASPGLATAYPKPHEQQWWFGTWGVQDRLWPITQGQGVTVAVLDTGVEAGIPDLAGVVLPGTDATGGGGDGRKDVDDSNGQGHGTGMASLIASQGKSTGFVGVAPRAKILPVVIKGMVGAAPAIRYATDHKAGVINISQGRPGPCPGDVQEAVGYALERDVVVVAAAGNDGDSSNASLYPANCAGVLAVGGVDRQVKPWLKSQRQPYVTVAAPGARVGGVLRDGQYYSNAGGTSSSSALTSAAVALVRSKYPKMPAREVVQRVIASAGDVSPPGKDNLTGYGRIRPYRALTESAPANTPNPVFAGYDKWAAEKKANAAKAAKPDEGAPVAWGALAIMLIPAGIIVVAVLFFRRRSRARPAPSGFPQPAMHQAPGGPHPHPGRAPVPPRQGGRPQFVPRDGGPPHGAPPAQNPGPGRPGQWDAPDRRP